jgi:DsbC/DsbD-like thiol-disulfide interchange protein
MKTFANLLLLLTIFTMPVEFLAAPAAPDPNISVVGYFAADKVQRGRTVRVGMVIDIPAGFHIHSNRPLENYLIATQLSIDAPKGISVGAVSYPRPLLKSFKFSSKKLSVYEKQIILRFNVTVPANYSGDAVDLKTRVRLQSCDDEVCFPPKTYNQSLRIDVVNPSDRVSRTNGWVFGSR